MEFPRRILPLPQRRPGPGARRTAPHPAGERAPPAHPVDDLRRLCRRILAARDDERRRLARELHDSAGQSLAALKMLLGRLAASLPEPAAVERALLAECSALADAACREVRTVCYRMHPPLLDEAGLAPALRWYAAGFSERSGIAVRVEAPEEFARLAPETEAAIFRVAQEALSNVHRHSASARATVRLERRAGSVRAEIRDWGRGFVPRRAGENPFRAGVGLAGMREWLRELGGELAFESVPGSGATVRAILPEKPAPRPPAAPEAIAARVTPDARAAAEISGRGRR